MGKSDPRDDELTRLRRALGLATFYLDRFADPDSFVWQANRPAHEFAREAVAEVKAECGLTATGESEPRLAAGTAPMQRLSGQRTVFVEFQLAVARKELDGGKPAEARTALRVLRTTDFSKQAQAAESLLAVLRDSRSTDSEVTDAAQRLANLTPSPLAP